MTDVWTIGRVVQWAADDFRTRGIEGPRLEAEILLAHALQIDRMRIILDAARPLTSDELTRYREMIRRRRAREPVAYIRGFREFYGRNFLVDSRVLIPRPDTESLVDTGLQRMAHLSLSARALDLCTGSGCVAISLAKERPTWHLTATDLSPDAVSAAQQNALRLGALRIRWQVANLFDKLDAAVDRFDLITANPPYITTDELPTLAPDIRLFEPTIALLGGGDGLDIVRRIVTESPRFLRTGGVLAMEVGSDQTGATTDLLRRAGFSDLRITRDYGGHERIVSGACAGA